MNHRRSARTPGARQWRALWLGLLSLLVAGPASATDFPQTTLQPRSDFARILDGVFMDTVVWATIVFVLVEGALLYTIVKFRGKPGDAEPKQVHGNTTAEIVWTIIPALILAMIAVPTVRAIFKTYEAPRDNPIEVEVIGHQWWWEFKYPQYGVTTANELHVPAGRPVALRMKTQDVLHSFWVPQFAGKRDVFPNRQTLLWFRTDSGVVGNFAGQCAEFCGIQHGRMAFRVVVDEPGAFQGFVDKLIATGNPAPTTQTATAGGLTVTRTGATLPADTTAAPAPAPEDPQLAHGKKLFLQKGCIGCHSINAKKPMGIGPNLAGVGSRSHIAAGWLENTDENLARWIREPQKVKEGVLMVVPPISVEESQALVKYLRTMR